MSTVNVGVVGIGNCTSALVQGVQFYADADPEKPQAGLMNAECAGYKVSDIRFVSAFDVNVTKIGTDLSEAIWAAPNNTRKFADVPNLGVTVTDGILSDGIGDNSVKRLTFEGRSSLDKVVEHLKDTETHVLVNFLPVGSQQASELYAEAALRAGCAFVNCIPSVIARSAEWGRKFQEANLPLIGDDLKSQVGATIVHRALVDLLANRGIHLRRTYQLNSGGNMDFYNMQDAERTKSKKTSKAQAIFDAAGTAGERLSDEDVYVAMSDFIPFLEDRKIAFIRLEAEAFGGAPLEIELRMCVWDSPNAAGTVIDAVRYLKAALDKNIGGVVDPVAAWIMKAPPAPMPERDAMAALQAFGTR